MPRTRQEIKYQYDHGNITYAQAIQALQRECGYTEEQAHEYMTK